MSRRGSARSDGRRTGPNAASAPPSGTRAPATPSRGRSVATVVAAALAVKATVLVQLGGHPLLQPLGELDTAFYVDLARQVADSGPLALAEPFFVSPLYVYFLAGVFALGGSLTAVRTIQIVLGAMAVGLLFVTTRHWFGDRAAWIAAALAILTGLFTFYEILILQAALDPFLVSLTLALVSRSLASASHRWPLAAGAAAGLLALNRPNALAYGVVAGLGLAIREWRAGTTIPRAFGRALVFPAALLLVLGASGLRNYAASGEWIAISSHGGLNFYIGNHAGADGTYRPVPGISASIAGQAHDAARVAETALGRRLSAAQVSDYFYAQALDWIGRNPLDAARLFAWKSALVVNRANVPLNFSYAYYSQDESSLLRGLIVGPWLIVPLGLVGLFVRSARRTGSGFWIWASFVPLYGLSIALFFVTSRYRMPLLLPLCALAAAALVWGFDQVRARRGAVVLRFALALVAGAALVNWPLGLDDGRWFEQTRQAVWLVEKGRGDAARAYVAQLAPGHSHPGLLHYRVGRALAATNRFDDAIEQFRLSLTVDPGELATRLELGQALTVIGLAADAVPHLAAALEGRHRAEVAAPWLVRALVAAGDRERAVALLATLPEAIAAPRADTALDLGTMALELDAPTRAERWLRLAVTTEPARAEAHEKLGVALLLQDRVGDAIGPLETACRLDASSASARLNLAATYARAGRVEEARSEAREALRLDPGEPRAAALLRALGPG
ncbi:MAG: glycosyltransferase family 39 protein [Vicinamibacterales bacterium]|nr:glycosyltransferase family 39 protein [Vicinamibacterales bacterium]